MKKTCVAIVVAGLSACVLYAACTWRLAGGATYCETNANCAEYKDPVPEICADSGATTGKQFGSSATNTVFIFIYNDGSCSSETVCVGGFLADEQEEQQVSSTCETCGTGG